MSKSVTNPSTRSNLITTGSQSEQDLRDSLKNPDQQRKRAEVINWLGANNYPALPVAPAQDAKKHPKIVQADAAKGIWQYCPLTASFQPIPLYTGKNPSYLDQDGIPHLINHSAFQNRLPTEAERQKWFANPLNGVGTLGGWNNTVWLDFDVKQFASQEECDTAVLKILEHPELQQTFIERSHSGGWRVGVRVKQEPDFTNFALSPGGSHVGEALKGGRFTVLAPTVGVSGNPYQSINRVLPVEVESLESIGIHSTSTKARTQTQKTPQQPRSKPSSPSYTPGSIPLEKLGTDTSREILQGSCLTGDRSEALATALQEWYGWQNWAGENDIPITGTPEDLAHYAGEQLGIDSDRVERIIKTIDIISCNPAALYKGGDESCWKKISKLDKPTFDAKCPIEIQNSIKSEWQKSSNQNSTNQKSHMKQIGSVTGDSRVNGDSQNSDTLSISDTVTTVTEILKKGFQDWLEINKLEEVRLNSELSNKEAFNALVRGIRCQFDDVQPEDEIKLRKLIDWQNIKLDFHEVLPSMARDILHDAEILNIDPIGIWQYLLPTCLSLVGKRVNLDLESHEIPAIAWTGLLADSGAGKTRAEKLVISGLKALQRLAKEKYKRELAEWEETIANWKEGQGAKPQKPVERKYLFDVATIQAVMRRQSEQDLNGSLWSRDELIGIFQSFGQFSKGENEALSCLLASWDGGSTTVDRVSQEDSYIIDSSRLSMAGGLQLGVFKKAFKDPDDCQGLQARFLFAIMKAKKPKRVKGFCHLSEKLPQLYNWLDNVPQGKVKLSVEADSYYDKLYEEIGNQAMNTSMPAIRAWMSKLSGQLMRIALALHLIECYHDQSRSMWTLQKDTLERAVKFAQYYRSTFHIVQTTAADTDDMSAILLQIWDKAVTRHPEGITTRDAYREIKAIQYRAKDAGRQSGAYTVDLFGKLEQMGKGQIIKNGRLVKFVANLNPPPINPDDNDGLKPEATPPSDRVTIPETIDISESEVSPESGLSPVTLPTHLEDEIDNSEVLEEGITPIQEEFDSTLVDELKGEVIPDSIDEESTGDVGIEKSRIPEELSKNGKVMVMWAIATINAVKNKLEQLTQQEEDEWKNEDVLKDMARELARCNSIDQLQVLRICWRNREALNAAAKRLTPEKHSQINKWVVKLNQTDPLFQIGDICKYSGKEFRLEKLCRKHKLQIVEISGDEATVECSEWNPSVTNVIPLADLKLIR